MQLGLFPVCGLCPFLPFPQWAEIILCPFHLIYNPWSIKRPTPPSDVSSLVYRMCLMLMGTPPFYCWADAIALMQKPQKSPEQCDLLTKDTK